MNNYLLTQMENIDFNTAVQSFIKKQCIIDFGIIQKVVAKGIVDVSVAVASTKQNIVITTCVLANISSASFTLDVEPNVGDRVLIFYPRTYDNSMFSVPEDEEEKKKIIINSNHKSYSLLGGIAFMFNQYRKDAHKNLLQIMKDGSFTYSISDEDGNKISEVNLSSVGSFSYATNDSDGNQLNEVKLNADGTASLSTKKDKDTALHTWELKSNEVSLVSKSGDDIILSLDAKADGITLEDKNGCKIVSSSSSIKINNKLEIKK